MSGGLLILVPLALVHYVWRASLPPLDGERDIEGVSAAVSLERDELGIPTITASNRADLAFGTGYAHGQDRFFQMDLSRRLAAGELTKLFGAAAAQQDAKAAIFEFRQVARHVIERATPAQREVVTAYARGVNAGLQGLRSRPWEYWVLRAQPEPWRAEDTILVVHAMWWDLQYAGFRREKVRREVEAKLGAATSFLYPNAMTWRDRVPLPSPEELDLSRSQGSASHMLQQQGARSSSDAGSNNWAVAGRRTASGGALVANDMHLNLRIPTTWYRARLRTGTLDLNGLTLPGAPVLVAGSNGHIAWGFTNSYGDWLDLERAPCSERAAGALWSRATEPGHCWFARWLATAPEATNLSLMDFENVTSVAQAMRLAPEIGIPHQNLVVGDRVGHIGWTIAGRIPRAHGAERGGGASGWLGFDEHPRIVDPESGRIWSANARVAEDPAQQLAIGDDEVRYGAEYDLGARAAQIGDALSSLNHPATPADMLAIQLDDRALFLARWRDLLLGLLDDAAIAEQPKRAELKQLLSQWAARASADSIAHRLIRQYRNQTELAVWRMILGVLGIEDDDAAPPVKFEHALWTLVTMQPRHMLAAPYGSWRELLLARVDALIDGERAACGSLSRCTWGRSNPTHVRHPLSRALGFMSAVLDMPNVELHGDHDMPRVQDGPFGASERFAVTPGREAEGYLHIAGGQSGHPLSPYYRAGFREWAEGKALPFLPGTTAHRQTLRPR